MTSHVASDESRPTRELRIKKQSQQVDQDMADAEADQDMADVAVVEHPHPHDDEEHAEWEHPTKGFFDGRLWTPSKSEQVSSARVGEPCDRPRTGKVWVVLPER